MVYKFSCIYVLHVYVIYLMSQIKTSGGTPNTVPIRWDKPDFMVLYGFNSLSEYDKLAESIKEGRLWNVLQYRAVSLERMFT